ncbi:MAG: ferrochelatase [Alphaproteobacteria bacterium]|nr:ferrochelatase [Alphaproteobacteria bacterium]
MTAMFRPAARRADILLPSDHPKVNAGKIGVLLLNLGTPDATDYWSMRRYLKEFLSDRRVIEVPRLLWWPILNLIILTVRPGRKGKDYDSIWNKELNESPLKTISRSQAEKLASKLSLMDDRIIVDWGMRYGNPSTPERLKALQAAGCDRILLVPLYPQSCAATSATACDKAFQSLTEMRWQPAIRVAPPWHDDPVYIDALAKTIQAKRTEIDFEPDMIVASFHGVPESYLLKGDPYHCQCMKTGRLLREALQLPKEKFMVCFQSRFGNEEWLKPYLIDTMGELPAKGIKKVMVIAPGFSADCLETLEEIEGENREHFIHHGGEKFAYVPCLNDSEEGLDVIQSVVLRELQGWI